MEITKVKISRLFTIEGYQNISFGYEAQPTNETEDPEDVKNNLFKRIDYDFLNFCINKDIKNDLIKTELFLKKDIESLKNEKQRMVNDVELYKKKYEKIRKYMEEKMGIENVFGDVPF